MSSGIATLSELFVDEEHMMEEKLQPNAVGNIALPEDPWLIAARVNNVAKQGVRRPKDEAAQIRLDEPSEVCKFLQDMEEKACKRKSVAISLLMLRCRIVPPAKNQQTLTKRGL